MNPLPSADGNTFTEDQWVDWEVRVLRPVYDGLFTHNAKSLRYMWPDPMRWSGVSLSA